MSQVITISSLAALSDDATLAALAIMQAAEHNTHRLSRRNRSNDLLSAIQDAESSWAGASAPEVVTGKQWYDTTNSLLKLRRAASWDTILDAASAYGVDLATAGTETFRVGGPFNVDTATYTKAGATGVLATYTLPAGQLARDNQYVHVVAQGTKSGTTATLSLQPRFGTTAITTHITSANVTDWAIEFWIVRTGAATQDAGSYMVLNRDDSGSTTLCDFSAALGKTLSGALAIDINVSAINAADTATQEMFLVEFGNY